MGRKIDRTGEEGINKFGSKMVISKYKMSIDGKHTDEFIIWYHMLERCYDPKYHEKEPTYKGCRIEDYLLNFQHTCAKIGNKSGSYICDMLKEIEKELNIK